MTFRNTPAISIAAICIVVSSGSLYAAAPTITFAASGTFAATPTSGADSLKLAGEPFSVSIMVSAAAMRYQRGSNWAAYNGPKLAGMVHTGLLGPTPATIASLEASIQQAIDPGQNDQFVMQAPVKVVYASRNGCPTLLHPFAPVSLGPGNATLS